MNYRHQTAAHPTVRLAHIVIILVSILVGACTTKHDEHTEERPTFKVTRPILMDTTIEREYVCQIRAIQHIELRALERGYLEKILVDEGQLVRKGQPMFQIMPVIYQAEYQHAQAEARVAEIEYLNTKSLADNNVVSPNELAMSKAKFDQAKAHVGLAKAHLDFTRISAPFTGIMDRLQVRTGSLLSEGDILAALSDNSSMWVYFNVPEAEYLNYMTLRQGAEHESVRLKMANGAVFDQPGKVTTIEADFNNETGNIAFRATFPNPKGLLRHGETGNILMTEEVKGAIIIPQKATFEVLDKKFVYVVGQDGIVHARQVTIKAELQHLYVIGSGIGTNDRILLDGLRKVKENDRIETTEVSPADVLRSLHLYAE